MDTFERKLDALTGALLQAESFDTWRADALRALRAAQGNLRTRVIEDEVKKVLLEFGLQDHLQGYRYHVAAITLAVEDPDILRAVTTRLYPKIGVIYAVSPQKVERAMRHAVENVFTRCDADIAFAFFGNTIDAGKCKPTNAQFVARMANIVRGRMERAWRN